MSRYEIFDRSCLELQSLSLRGHDLTWSDCLPLAPPAELFDHPEFADLMDRIRQARDNERPVVLMMGAHPCSSQLLRRCAGGRQLYDFLIFQRLGNLTDDTGVTMLTTRNADGNTRFHSL